MATLKKDDLALVKKTTHSFQKDFNALLKKHKLDNLNVNLRFTTPAALRCKKVWVNDGLGRHCWKCVGDVTPCGKGV